MTATPVHSTWAATLKTALGAAAAVTIVLLAFAWPTFTSEVHDLPVAVAGPEQAVVPIEKSLQQHGDPFVLERADSREHAVRMIEERETYGAVVVGADGTEVLTASAASPVATQVLSQVATGMKEAGQQVTVTDVVPLSEDDPRGAGLAVAALPLAMGGMIGGVMISLLVAGARQRITAAALYGVVGGLVLTGVLQGWFGFIGGSFVTNAAAIGLALTATAATISGFHALIGRVGIAVGAVITMFVGNPLSSASAPQEFLPGPFGDIGQFFVPGAASTLLRLTTYFPEASTLQPWLVLAGWTVLGAALTLVGHFRDDEVVHVDGATEPNA